MNTSTDWKLRVVDPKDGRGYRVVEISDDLLEILDCTDGDELAIEVINQRIVGIKKLGMAVNRNTNKRLSYVEIYQMSSTDYLHQVIDGVSSQSIKDLAFDMGVTQTTLCRMLGLSPSAISRKVKSRQHLSAMEGELVLGLGKLIGRFKELYNEFSEDQDFKNTTWIAEWLQSSLPALGGEKPMKYLCSIAGQQYVGQIIGQAIHGSYT